MIREHAPGAYYLSPFMEVSERFISYPAYASAEAGRRHWLSKLRPLVERVATHFQNKSWDLFSKDVNVLDSDVSVENQKERFEALCYVTHAALPAFTFDHTKLVPRIKQRLALADSISPQLTRQDLLGKLQTTGRLLEWWKQVNAVRASLYNAYPYVHTLLQPLYWKDKSDAVAGYVVSSKRFDVLKDLYISAFETLARISVIAVGLEAIIHYKELKLPTKKASLSIFDFEALSTANKRDHLDRYPIGDIFHDFLDTNVRNGIGHHAARYDPINDTIDLVKNKGDELTTEEIPYTEFCRKVLSMASRLFAVETYLNAAILTLGGHIEPEP